MTDINKLIDKFRFRLFGLSPDLIAPQMNKLLRDYGIPPDLVQMETWMAACINMASEPHPEMRINLLENYSENEHDMFTQLCTQKNLKINRVEITASGLNYVFEKDSLIKSFFEDFLKSQAKKEKGLRFLKVKIPPPHHDAILIEDFLKAFINIARKRYLFIWQLYKLGGYPFSKSELEAIDQNKASLISNWIKRNKNQRLT